MEILFLLLFVGLGVGAFALAGGSDDGGDAGDGGDDEPPGRVLVGTGGNDLLAGGDGPDRIFGGDGDDTLLGGEGNDSLFAEAGADLLFGGPGNDLLRGGGGPDTMFALSGEDTLFGETGSDFLVALDGPDRPGAPDELSGGFGVDFLVGDDGDTLTGGADADIFAVVRWTHDDAPVVIRDFTPDEDRLEIIADRTGFNAVMWDDLFLAVDQQRGQVNVQLFGRTVAILEGVTEPPEDVVLLHQDMRTVLENVRQAEAAQTARARATA
jgi:Ca2+-binding RTX toxin-like protein